MSTPLKPGLTLLEKGSEINFQTRRMEYSLRRKVSFMKINPHGFKGNILRLLHTGSTSNSKGVPQVRQQEREALNYRAVTGPGFLLY